MKGQNYIVIERRGHDAPWRLHFGDIDLGETYDPEVVEKWKELLELTNRALPAGLVGDGVTDNTAAFQKFVNEFKSSDPLISKSQAIEALENMVDGAKRNAKMFDDKEWNHGWLARQRGVEDSIHAIKTLPVVPTDGEMREILDNLIHHKIGVEPYDGDCVHVWKIGDDDECEECGQFYTSVLVSQFRDEILKHFSVPLVPQSDELQEIVDEQAEDEGLWCEAANIVEAYLQQELRRLHTAIENRSVVAGELTPCPTNHEAPDGSPWSEADAYFDEDGNEHKYDHPRFCPDCGTPLESAPVEGEE